MALHRSAVGAAEQHLPCRSFDPGPVEDLGERNPGPLRRADRAQVPFLALDRRLEQRSAITGALEGDDLRLGGHPAEVSEAQAERALDEAADAQAPAGWIERRDLEVVAHVEVRTRHDDPADQRGDRGLAVERVRPMDDEAGVDRTLVGFPWIDRRTELLDGRYLSHAAAAAHHSRRRIHLYATRRLEGPQKRPDAAHIARLDDHVDGVLALNDRLRLQLDALPFHVRRAQVVQQQRTHLRVGCRAALGRVLVTDDEKRHDRSSGTSESLVKACLRSIRLPAVLRPRTRHAEYEKAPLCSAFSRWSEPDSNPRPPGCDPRSPGNALP